MTDDNTTQHWQCYKNTVNMPIKQRYIAFLPYIFDGDTNKFIPVVVQLFGGVSCAHICAY